MGYELYREVKDHAPADLHPTELLLLLIVADDANDQTRLSFAAREQLVRWMRMTTWDSVQKVLNRLAKRELEIRVPIGKDRSGRAVFARVGQKTTYRVPEFLSRADNHPPSEGGQPSALDAGRADDHPQEGGYPSARRGQPSAPSPHPSGSPHLSLVGTAEHAIRGAGLDDEREINDCIEWITETHRPRGPGWWRAVTENGDLPALVAAWRAQRAPGAPSLPDWCGQCADGNPAARSNPRWRVLDGQPCPACHPAARETA
ncbi:hypothetical protein [Frankia sp. EI5c]|uniref:hypothetical protein n=1 Tax=Frankia sp. EI5c TaxID=683316 RepID=UPI000825D65D|nr:hypothetical protein [Frankia sp. EI5c]